MNKEFIFKSIVLLILLVTDCVAQDTIFMRNDQRIPCNVVEVNTTEVKYKKLEITDGPLYIESKSAVAQIKYKNGFVDVFFEAKSPSVPPVKNKEVVEKKDDYVRSGGQPKLNRLNNNLYRYGEKFMNEKGMHQMLLSLKNPEITKEIEGAKRSRKLKYVGFLAIPLAIGGMVAASMVESDTYPSTARNEEFIAPAVICLTSATIVFSASIYFGIDRKVKNAKAVGLYKQKYEGH